MQDLFFGTSGPRSSNPIMIVGESWGETEAQQQQPFVGLSGHELTRMLSEAGIDRRECFFTNVVSERPYENDIRRFFYTTAEVKSGRLLSTKGLYPKENVLRGLETLQKQIEVVKPRAVIAFGNYALWALTSSCYGISNSEGWKIPTGITSWRGSQLYVNDSQIPLMPTYHPAAIMRQWSWRYAAMHDLRQRFSKALKNEWGVPQYEFEIRPSFTTVMQRIQWIEAQLPCNISVDLETAFGHIGCVGLGWSRLQAICIPFWRKDTREAYWSPAEECEIIIALRRLLLNPLCRIVGQNFLYDAQYTSLYWGLIPHVHLDTLIIHHLCWPGTPRGLDYLSSLYCRYHSYWKDEGKEWHPSFSDDQQWTYNCKDCVATWECGDVLEGLVRHLKLEEQAKFQMEQFHLALDMMIRGAPVNHESRVRLSKELGEAETKLAEWLENILPIFVYPRKKKAAKWYDSPKQTMEILFEVFNLPAPGGRRSSDDETMKQLMLVEPMLSTILQGILDLRSVRKFRRDFVEARVGNDMRMRCSFDPAGTKTFRWSSSQDAFGNGANLQTIPKGTEE